MAITGENNQRTEPAGVWSNKSELEKALSIGLSGAPEIGRDEKRYFLGEFRERVIKMLTKKQVEEPGIHPDIVRAIKDNRAVRMFINGDIDFRHAKKYSKMAEQSGIKVTTTDDPQFRGDAGLVIVSDKAVDLQDIYVEDRKTRLRQLGVPETIIDSAGKKVCDKCLNKVLRAAPDESVNYNRVTWADHFWGEHCPACEVHTPE